MELEIKKESGFSMKSKLDIECALAEEMQHLVDPNHPMDEMQWANNQGWVEALEFVLDDQAERIEKEADIKRIEAIGLTEIERNNIITKSIKKLQQESKIFDDDKDSEPCDTCTCGLAE